MFMKKNVFIPFLMIMAACSHEKVFNVADYGIKPNTENATPLFACMMQDVADCKTDKPIVIRFDSGTYHFYETELSLREYYISNHDQENPKKVGMALEHLRNVTIDGQGADFVFHGRMLPVSLIHSENCTLKNFSIDFARPHIVQVEVLENKGKDGIVFELAPYYNYRITEDEGFETFEADAVCRPFTGIAFEPDTKHILYRTSDLNCDLSIVKPTAKSRVLYAPKWQDERLKKGTLVALRTYHRPAPAVFLSEDKNVTLKNVKIHYAEGMGVLAQLCKNILLDSVSVCLKDSSRCFTTQADATHFSGCKGKIVSKNGLYENMMDDAINVHGTYLKLLSVVNDSTVEAAYMHPQTWGFKWGDAGDSVQFIKSETMDVLPTFYKIKTITPKNKNAKEFVITFDKPLAEELYAKEAFGMENLTWTPSVEFLNNVVRNNRARGALFSTPREVKVLNNTFDHVSGAAILLCGDCNGWYETGACRNVLISGNKFENVLTSLFQFTNAVISIYPEIPCLEKQNTYFHRNITITDNLFQTFDKPIVYAKSTDGLYFRNNTVIQTSDYDAYHSNTKRFWLQRVKNFCFENNTFEQGFNYTTDVKEE